MDATALEEEQTEQCGSELMASPARDHQAAGARASPVECRARLMEVRLMLEFACCHCHQPVEVTVDCRGPMQSPDPSRIRMAVVIPCPDCHGINQVYFDPGGTVHAVEPNRTPRPTYEPSLN